MRSNKLEILFLFFLLIPFSGKCQKWVADSIIIEFGKEKTTKNLGFNLADALDKRKTFPEFISVFERKKWLFFPVDQIVKTSNPLAYNLKQKFHTDSAVVNNYVTVVHDFNIKNSTALGRRELTLFSTLELFQLNGFKDTSLVGSFYYEGTFRQKTKESLKDGYEFIIDEWSKKYSNDILFVEKSLDLELPEKLYYFRRGEKAIKKNFYTSVDFFAGLKFWGIDGELWFSEPEGNRMFNRNSGVIRYVNHPDFQAIAIGSNVRHLSYRINENLLFDNKMSLLMGINNWKDMKTASHKLEEILFFNASMTQRINYNRLDKSGFVFGIGIMEDLHYVIHHKVKLNIGLSLNFAYKF